jgi:hypothetical protein
LVLVSEDYLRAYKEWYRKKEIDAFNAFIYDICVDDRAVPRKSARRRIEILVVHIVGMARHWTEFTSAPASSAHLNIVDARQREVREFYRQQFDKAHQRLRKHPAVERVVEAYLPAEFQFGDVEVKYKDRQVKVFGFAKDSLEENSDYEDQRKIEVMKQAALAHSTLKTVRALRLAMHRKPQNWLVREVGTNSPEADLFDLWTTKAGIRS